MKKAILLILIAIIAVGYIAAKNMNKLSGTSGKRFMTPSTAVSYGALSSAVSGRGKLMANRTVSVTPAIDGQIVEITVKEGEQVTKGQCLVRIDLKPELKFKLLDLKRRTLANLNQKKELTRKAEFQRKLNKEGLAAQIELESLENQIQWTAVENRSLDNERQILGKELGLPLTRSTLLDTDISEMEKSCINSIIDGTVLQINNYAGDMLSASGGMNNTSIMDIGDLSEYYIDYKVNELDLGKIKVGQPVEIRFDSLPDKLFHGEIEKIGTMAFYDMQPGSFMDPSKEMSQYKTKIRVTDAGSEIRPDLSCRISIQTETKSRVLLAPVTSVFTDEEGKQFILVQQDKSVEYRPVQVGIADIEMIEILSGLKEGEVVYVKPYEMIEHKKIIDAAQSKTLVEKLLH